MSDFRVHLPSDAEIRDLHRTCAPSREAFTAVYTHSRIVWAVAQQLLDRAPGSVAVNADLVRAGCLLHDIGVYRLYDPAGRIEPGNYVRHGVLGHQLLREAGFDEELARFCSRHVGVGLLREDVLEQGLPIPAQDYLPESGEEELVMYADKFHSKTAPPVFLTARSYAAHVQRYGLDKVTRFDRLRARFGEPDLGQLVQTYGHALSRADPSWPEPIRADLTRVRTPDPIRAGLLRARQAVRDGRRPRSAARAAGPTSPRTPAAPSASRRRSWQAITRAAQRTARRHRSPCVLCAGIPADLSPSAVGVGNVLSASRNGGARLMLTRRSRQG